MGDICYFYGAIGVVYFNLLYGVVMFVVPLTSLSVLSRRMNLCPNLKSRCVNRIHPKNASHIHKDCTGGVPNFVPHYSIPAMDEPPN